MNFAPPTDSLYKFSAIVGTILVVLSIFLPQKMGHDLRMEMLDSILKVAVLKVEIGHLKEGSNQLKEIIDHTVAMQQGRYKPDRSKVEMAYSQDEVKQLLKEITNSRRDIDIKMAEIENAGRRIEMLERELYFTWGWLVVGCFVGFFMARWGYVNWYRKIQVHQDRIIKELPTKGEQIGPGS